MDKIKLNLKSKIKSITPYFPYALILLIGIVVWNITSAQTINTTTFNLATPTDLMLANNQYQDRFVLKWNYIFVGSEKIYIERKSSNTSESFLVVGNSSETYFTDSSIIPGVYYYYRVRACYAETMCSSYSNILGGLHTEIPTTNTDTSTTTNTTDNTVSYYAPNMPTDLRADSYLSNSVILRWRDNSNDENWFVVERVINGTTDTFSKIGEPVENSFTDSSIIPGNYYNYRVKACKPNLCSEYVYLTGVHIPINIQTSTTVSDSPTTTPSSETSSETTSDSGSTTNTNTTTNTTTTKTPTATTTAPQISNDVNNILSLEDKIIESLKEENIKEVLEALDFDSKVEDEDTSEIEIEKKIDLVYKDSNKDGISDFDSVHVYKMDPVKPSPTSTYEGRKINASEKILLGFDPTVSKLVEVIPEQPQDSTAKIVSSYKVNEVKRTEEKKLFLKGVALPNSFVTIYIYSTPVIVTVKANSDGEWQYTLDKELESGEHTVYTATVNNTGKILAKSSSFSFIATAEAATLVTQPVIQPGEVQEPGLLNKNNILVIGFTFLTLVIGTLLIIGMTSKNNPTNPPPDQNQ